ncbi:unnamed protein product [Prorocentrum cordatum]|uniref:Uncharacterized protein n=1 Tax=Prorocentrum cordatum TaxID=2364126 RepID=A0ABN9QE33_9DINO|nr:unnamed protein product [Polarella glacialis]
MVSGVVQLWAWILQSGRLQPLGATPVSDLGVVCGMSDASVHIELSGGASHDCRAVMFSSDRRLIPPGIDCGQAAATLVPAAVPVVAAAQWVTVETTAFTSKETPGIIGVSSTERGEVGIFTNPSGIAVLERDMQACPSEEYRESASARDLRPNKAATVATNVRSMRCFTCSVAELSPSPFLDWSVK